MASSDTKVKVPATAGPEISISIGGDSPVVYKPTDGVVTVRREHLDRILSAVAGSAIVGDPPPPDPSAPSRSGAV